MLSVSYAPEEGILVLVQSARSGTPWEGGDLRRPCVATMTGAGRMPALPGQSDLASAERFIVVSR